MVSKPTSEEIENCDYRKGAEMHNISPLCEDCAGCQVMMWSILTIMLPHSTDLWLGYHDQHQHDLEVARVQEYILGCPPVLNGSLGLAAIEAVMDMTKHPPFVHKLLKEYGI